MYLESLKLNYCPATFLLISMPDTIASYLSTSVRLTKRKRKKCLEFKYEDQRKVREIYKFLLLRLNFE